MNDVLRVIKERRTTRKFEQTQIEKAELEAIIEAGLYAPSAHNHQSWHFTVVSDSEMLNELNTESKKAALNIPDDMIQNMAKNEKFNVFYDAPTIIIVSGREDAMLPEIDCAAATQNMLLAAESLEIGSCWNGFVGILFGSEKGEEYSKKLGIPSGYKPYHAVALGYKAVKATAAPARKEDAVAYYNK